MGGYLYDYPVYRDLRISSGLLVIQEQPGKLQGAAFREPCLAVRASPF